jgi:hypothetical protein
VASYYGHPTPICIRVAHFPEIWVLVIFRGKSSEILEIMEIWEKFEILLRFTQCHCIKMTHSSCDIQLRYGAIYAMDDDGVRIPPTVLTRNRKQ